MYFSKSLQGSKRAITMSLVSIESNLLLSLHIWNFLDLINDTQNNSFCIKREVTMKYWLFSFKYIYEYFFQLFLIHVFDSSALCKWRTCKCYHSRVTPKIVYNLPTPSKKNKFDKYLVLLLYCCCSYCLRFF